MTVFFGLGTTGRFGNQIVEYTICKYLEYIHGTSIYHSEWLGHEFYKNATQQFIIQTIEVKQIHMDTDTWRAMTLFKLQWLKMKGEINPSRKVFINAGPDSFFLSREMDIQNKVLYHQPRVHLSYLKPQETFIRSLFVLQDSFKEAIRRVLIFLRKTKKLVVMHVRKDDFDFMLNPLFIYVDQFYIDWLKNNFDPQFMVLYVCGQYDGKLKSRLSAYSPIYLHNVLREFPDLGELHKHVDIIIDHGLMRAADVVLSCNSSFSFTACMLSDNKQAKFFRQDFVDKRLNEYDPWMVMSYEAQPMGLKWLIYYLRYKPFFGFQFIWYVLKRLLQGKRILELSYN